MHSWEIMSVWSCMQIGALSLLSYDNFQVDDTNVDKNSLKWS